MIRKILLAAGAAALMSTPAWALPGNGQGHGQGPVGPSSTTPDNGGDHGHKGQGDTHGHHGKSHKCMPHKVGYVASGVLIKQTLTANTDGTYSGEVEVEVTHTNHHATADMGKHVYTLTHVHVTLGVEDVNKDGSVGLDDLAAGDRVHVIGKITALAKKCNSSGFTAETTIRKIVFNAPSGSDQSKG